MSSYPLHHHRHSIRLKGWDYRSPGYYFVTIVTYQREPLFDTPEYHELAVNMLFRVPEQPHAQHLELDEFIIMPEHGHIIFNFKDYPANFDPTLPIGEFRAALAGSLGVVVGHYKTAVTTRLNQLRRTPGAKVWQRGYYERIIRDESHLQATRQYILDNPIKHKDDLDKLLPRMTYHL